MTARPSVLAVTSQLPWPLNTGGHLRTFHLLRELSVDFRVRLIAGMRPDQIGDANALRQAGIDVHPVDLASTGPIGQAAHVMSAAAQSEPYVLYRRHDRREVRAAVRRHVSAARPDLLYLDHLDSWSFAGEANALPTVLDLHNLYSLLIRREADAASRPWIVRTYLRREGRLLERIERAAVRGAGAVFAVSPAERQHFAALREGDVQLIPNGVDCARYAALPTGRVDSRPVILFIGTLSWPPNRAAALRLATDVLPAIQRTHPDASLTLVGRDPSPEIRALASNPAIRVMGSVDDILPFLAEARLLAVPLDAGGGTRLKILEAFAAGLPVASTPIGCEGIDAEPGRELLVGDGDRFIDAVRTLVSNPVDGAAVAHHARQLALTRYDWRVIGAAARTAVRQVIGRGSNGQAGQ